MRHFIEFLFSKDDIDWYRLIELDDNAPSLIEFPEGAIAYCFYNLEKEEDLEILRDESRENFPPVVFLGTEYTLEEVKTMFPENETIISDMEEGGWKRVVQTPNGEWWALREKDSVISE